jgi:hypothetical protein
MAVRPHAVAATLCDEQLSRPVIRDGEPQIRQTFLYLPLDQDDVESSLRLLPRLPSRPALLHRRTELDLTPLVAKNLIGLSDSRIETSGLCQKTRSDR